MEIILKYMVKLRDLAYKIYGNFHNRNTIIDYFLINYYDNLKYDKDIIIILHGFSSNKESLLPIACNLTNKYRIVIPDLIEHGNTRKLNIEDTDLTITYQLELLKNFIDIISNNSKVHIVGYSMGGLLAGCLSAKYPDIIKTATLISPAGISMVNHSPVYRYYLDTNDNLLSIRTEQKAKRLLHLLHCRYKLFPNVVFKYFSNLYNKNADNYDKIFNELIINEYPYLENQLEHIKSNLLVIWGANDQVIDKSCVFNIEKNIQTNYNIYIVDDAEHIIHTTHSKICANYINQQIVHYSNNL